MPTDWRDVPLSRDHDRAAFDCGDAAINSWFSRYARQSHESGGAKTFVAVENAALERILGFYSLSPASVEYAKVPLAANRGSGRYEVPVFRLDRLAVDVAFQRKGLGAGLLVAATRRCHSVAAQVGGVGVLIDAKNERIAEWYASFGALPFPDHPLTLVLTFEALKHLLRNGN